MINDYYYISSKDWIALIPRTRTPAILPQPNKITTTSSSAELYFIIRIIDGHSEVCRTFVFYFTRPLAIDQILAANLHSATVRLPSQVVLNLSYQAALPGGYNAYQLTENSLLIFNQCSFALHTR